MRSIVCALLLTLLTTVSHAADIIVKDNTVSIIGGIVSSDYSDFLNKVSNLDRATVVLNSPGGQLGPALMIGRFISKNKWITYVPNSCNSACALIFLSGYERYRDFGASIGVHSSSDANTHIRSLTGNQMIESYLIEMGYSHSFYEFFTKADPSNYQWLYQQSSELYELAIRIGKPPFIKTDPAKLIIRGALETIKVPIGRDR